MAIPARAGLPPARHIGLIRNFRRYSWLLMYLGASPALDAGFLRGRPHQLEALDADTLYLPYATSLRMSDLGTRTMPRPASRPATTTCRVIPKASTAQFPRRMHPTRQWASRTPPATGSSSTPTCCRSRTSTTRTFAPSASPPPANARCRPLRARGIQYIEVRCLDINPFLPLGIDLNEARFLDAFLLFCALADSPCSADGEARPPTTSSRWSRRADAPACSCSTAARPSRSRVGRPAARRDRRSRRPARPQPWRQPACRSTGRTARQGRRQQPDAPARVLEQLRTNGESFSQFAMRQTLAHADYFRSQAPSANELQQFETAARQSLERQAAMEAADEPDFDSFVADYQRSSNRPAGATPASRLQSGFRRSSNSAGSCSEARAAGKRSTLMGSKPRPGTSAPYAW